MSVACAKPTPSGPCQRRVATAGAHCGVDHLATTRLASANTAPRSAPAIQPVGALTVLTPAAKLDATAPYTLVAVTTQAGPVVEGEYLGGSNDARRIRLVDHGRPTQRVVEVGDADITAVEVNRHQPPKFATGHQWRGRKKPPTPAQIIFGHLERSGYPQPEHAAAALHAPRSLDGWKLIETDDPDGDLGRPVAVVDAGGVVDALTLAAHHTPAQGQGWRLVDANGYTAMSTGPDGAVRLHQTRTTTTPPQRTAAQPLLVKCPECGLEGPAGMPSHRGSTGCQSGSIASGAPQQKAHCSCDLCY